MSNIDAIKVCAEEYARVSLIVDSGDYSSMRAGYIDGATSNAAKQYWFEQFKAEQKQAAGITNGAEH